MAEDWWLYYDARGWLVGGAPMARWQSSLSRWAINARGKEPQGSGPQKPRAGTPLEIDVSERERREVDACNAEMERKRLAEAERIRANFEWGKSDPETRGPKPYPKHWETDQMQEVSE